MSDKTFFYQQYNELDWPNQAQTAVNGFIHAFIIDELIFAKKPSAVKIFDIGFGIGAFIRMVIGRTGGAIELLLEGCEPSEKNYRYFCDTPLPVGAGIRLKTHPVPFLETQTEGRFQFITAVYVFPHIPAEDLEETAQKIHDLLEADGQFIMVVVNDQYLKERLNAEDGAFTLFEKSEIGFDGKKYMEYIHYSDLPGIGRILDHSREENFYIDFFRKNGLSLVRKNDLEDSGYVCSVYVFQKHVHPSR